MPGRKDRNGALEKFLRQKPERMDKMKTLISNIDGKWYAYAVEKDNVYSIGADSAGARRSGGYAWTARWTDSGIQFVSSPSASRAAAYFALVQYVFDLRDR